MAVVISNVQHNHRGLYFEATGDGATTALTVNHAGRPHTNTTATARVITSPTSYSHRSGNGGFLFPEGASAAVSSVVITAASATVNTSAAIGNGTKAYVAVVFDQPSAA
jgi:hypothetical protein